MQREWFEKDYYAVLGVPETASQKEITSAYRKLARELHPDANPGDEQAEDRFKEVSAAYEVIGDPEQRKKYDEARKLANGRRSAVGPVGGGGFGPGGIGSRPATSRTCWGTCSAGARRWCRTADGAAAWADLEADLHLSFEARSAASRRPSTWSRTCAAPSASAPGRRPAAPRTCPTCHGRGAIDEDQGFFSFSRPCTTCGGHGRLIDQPCSTCGGAGAVRRPRQVRVRIPKGVRDGQRIRVKGKGGAGANGGPDGDLYVQVHVGPHPLFGRSGDNLTITVRSPSRKLRSGRTSPCRRWTAARHHPVPPGAQRADVHVAGVVKPARAPATCW